MTVSQEKPQSSSVHHRINEQLSEYWQSLCAERVFPNESDIDPAAISEIWDACFLVQVAPAFTRNEYKYAYLGLSLIEAWGDDFTGREVSAKLIAPDSPPLVKKFEEVLSSQKPVIDESEFTNKNGIQIRYRSCLLPLGKAPGEIKYIIGGMKWKAY